MQSIAYSRVKHLLSTNKIQANICHLLVIFSIFYYQHALWRNGKATLSKRKAIIFLNANTPDSILLWMDLIQLALKSVRVEWVPICTGTFQWKEWKWRIIYGLLWVTLVGSGIDKTHFWFLLHQFYCAPPVTKLVLFRINTCARRRKIKPWIYIATTTNMSTRPKPHSNISSHSLFPLTDTSCSNPSILVSPLFPGSI